MDERDEALDGLSAADPAADVETRHGVLRAKVDRLAGTGAGAPADGGTDETPRDDRATRRDRRRAPWLVAAGVVGAVLVGGGGYALGSAGTSDDVVAEQDAADGTVAVGEADALPPLALEGGPTGGAASPEGAADAARSTMLPGYGVGGRAASDQEGLSTSGTTATAYAYDATAVATRAGAAQVAADLGVEGAPRWEGGAWAVGPADGTGPTLYLSADATAHVSVSYPDRDPWRCEDARPQDLEDSGASSGSLGDGGGVSAVEPVCATPEGSVPVDAAAAALRELMSDAGVDPAGFELEAAESGDVTRWVTAHQVVDDRRTGAAWSASVGPDGVVSADGFLAATVPLGDYPVVSPAEAVERLSDPRFGQNLWPIAYAAQEPASDTVTGLEPAPLPEPDLPQDPGEPTAPPAPPSSGSDLPWPVRDVTITAATLGLAQEHGDGGTLLLPAYELRDADGNLWTVVAVAEDALDMTAP